MRTNIGMLLILAALFAPQACKGGCKIDPIKGTRETADKPYSGDKNATAPYSKTEWVHTMEHGECKPQGCTYSALARVMLHNPTTKSVTANVHCRFTLGGDYEFGTNQRNGVKVAAQRSKGVEIQQMVDVEPGRANTIGATCTAVFK